MSAPEVVLIMFRRTWICAVFALTAACSEPIDHLVVSLTTDRHIAAPGDTVSLLASVYNPTSSVLEIGYGCGPSLDFHVTEPGGATSSLLAGKAFICPLVDYHILEPWETDSIPWKWTAPATRGTYVFQSGVRTSTGLRDPSPPVRVDVR
jgi:hypothetical protein